MALENGTETVMPVAPMYGGFNGMNGWSNFGGNDWWVVLFLFAMMGNGGWGGFGNWGGMGMADAVMPYFYNAQTQGDVNRGFDTQNLQSQIASVQGSVDNLRTDNQLQNIQSAITNGFAGAESSNCNRYINNLNAMYQNQIADMNQRFSLATAVDDRLDNLAMILQKCCCDNELATANTQNLITREAAENRFQSLQNTNSIITNNTANTQAILDKLCQLELDGVKSDLAAAQRENDNLRTAATLASVQASQVAQTGQLMADNAAQTQYIVNRVAPYPIPAYNVGNPYWYNNFNNNGCGCCNG